LRGREPAVLSALGASAAARAPAGSVAEAPAGSVRNAPMVFRVWWQELVLQHRRRVLTKEPNVTTKLNQTAREALGAAGIDPAQWMETYGGDRCGCTDARCIGNHHEPDEDCGCLPVCIQQHIAEQTPERPAILDSIPVPWWVDAERVGVWERDTHEPTWSRPISGTLTTGEEDGWGVCVSASQVADDSGAWRLDGLASSVGYNLVEVTPDDLVAMADQLKQAAGVLTAIQAAPTMAAQPTVLCVKCGTCYAACPNCGTITDERSPALSRGRA